MAIGEAQRPGRHRVIGEDARGGRRAGGASGADEPLDAVVAGRQLQHGIAAAFFQAGLGVKIHQDIADYLFKPGPA